MRLLLPCEHGAHRKQTLPRQSPALQESGQHPELQVSLTAGLGHKELRDDGNTRAPTGTQEQRWLELQTAVHRATAKLKTRPAVTWNHGIVETRKALTAH